jgi:methyl-accepting chemotaxis protein
MSDPFSTLREQYNLAGELAGTLTEQMQSDSQAVVDSRQHITLIIAAISVLIGLILSYVNPRMIVTAVNEVRGKIDDISQGEGDLVSRIPIKTGDELGQLSGSLNRLLDQLQHLIRDVISDVGHLGDQSSGLGRIVHDAEVISDRQHAQLNTLVTAFTEIGHAINDISQHAQQTSAQSQDAQAAANQGMELLEENIAMNNRLSASVQNAGQIVTQLAAESERITSVLDVIRGIAEQTNLLALNAAIEAARAGDQGRGFAVVADEVRTLAGRTQNSTEDIQKMISSLKQQVANAVAAMESGFEQMQASVKMTGQMRGTFSDIQGLVGQVQEMNVQIASATEQQSLVMNEINQGMSQLSELTEEAHRISNSVSQCGQQMESLTGQLSGRVKKFRV